MKIGVVLSERFPFSLEAGAIARKCYDTFSRFSKESEIVVFSRPIKRYAYKASNLRVATMLSGYLKGTPVLSRYFRRCYAKEVALRARGVFDIVFVFNRPQFIPQIKKANKRSKIILHMGNDHLTTLDYNLCADAVNGCDLIIGLSKHICENIVRRFPEASDRVRLVYNGVDIEKFSPSPASFSGASRSGGSSMASVLFAGRLVPEKGAHLLIEAMGNVFEIYPGARLEIVGSTWFGENSSSSYIDHLRTLAAPFGDRVIFKGYVRSDLMPEVFRHADIAVIPSVWEEPLGNVALEAMACGLPVIGSKRGGIPEAIGDAGLVCEPDVQSLIRNIVLVLRDESLRRELGMKARKRVEEYFNWNVIAPQVERLLEGIL